MPYETQKSGREEKRAAQIASKQASIEHPMRQATETAFGGQKPATSQQKRPFYGPF